MAESDLGKLLRGAGLANTICGAIFLAYLDYWAHPELWPEPSESPAERENGAETGPV